MTFCIKSAISSFSLKKKKKAINEYIHVKSCADSWLTRCCDFSSVVPGVLFSASASAPPAVGVTRSRVWVWVWGHLSTSETINTFWAEPFPERRCQSKLHSESKCGGVLRTMAKNKHNLWLRIGFDFKASEERKPGSPSC